MVPAAPIARIPQDGPAGAPTGSKEAVVDGGGTGGTGGGGLGGVGGSGTYPSIPLDKLPKLKNLREILKNMRKFYPESERRAGREGAVVIKVHIGEDGRVIEATSVQSTSKAFEKAAIRVGQTMRFEPAEYRGRAVPVRLPQKIVFELD